MLMCLEMSQLLFVVQGGRPLAERDQPLPECSVGTERTCVLCCLLGEPSVNAKEVESNSAVLQIGILLMSCPPASCTAEGQH